MRPASPSPSRRTSSGRPSAREHGGRKPAIVIAVVFLGSALVAAVLFAIDARERARGGATESPLVPAPTSTSSVATEESAGVAPEARASSRDRESDSATTPGASPLAVPDHAATHPKGDEPCFDDMVLVSGAFCPFVAHQCLKKRPVARAGDEPTCERFKNEVLCEGSLALLRFCIDRYEYPNRKGVTPAALVSFEEAERACAVEDKRLCTVREWTFACEGEAIVPYSTGLVRDPKVCNLDGGREGPVAPTRGSGVASAMLAIDKRAPSGARPECASPFGVLDMTGNVAEWAFEPMNGRTTDPFASVIVGGAWGGGPSTCRAKDDGHPPVHRASNVGFRCCVDAFGPPPKTSWSASHRKGGGLRPIQSPNPNDARTDLPLKKPPGAPGLP